MLEKLLDLVDMDTPINLKLQYHIIFILDINLLFQPLIGFYSSFTLFLLVDFLLLLFFL